MSSFVWSDSTEGLESHCGEPGTYLDALVIVVSSIANTHSWPESSQF